MNPFEPQSSEVPTNSPAAPPVSVTTPPVQPLPVKSHKKLIIILIASAVLFFAAVGVAGWFVVTQVIPGLSTKDPAESSAENFLLVGNTPEEVYYNNLAVTYGYNGSYDELVKSNQQSEIDRIVQTGKDICSGLANDTLTQDDVDKKVYPSVFATAEASLCPEQKATLDALMASFGDPALSHTYEDAHSLILDGTVDVEGLLLAHTFCFVSASFIFGSNDPAVTEDEADEVGKTTCLALMGEFETNIEFYEWSSNKEEERSRILLDIAKREGMESATCRELIDCTAGEQ